MALKGSKSHGEDTRERVKRVLQTLLALELPEFEKRKTSTSKPTVCQWTQEDAYFILSVNNCRVKDIQYRVNHDGHQSDVTTDQVKESFGDLEALGILLDRRGPKKQGATLWHFDLHLKSRDIPQNLDEFVRNWKKQWDNGQNRTTSKAKRTATSTTNWQKICRDMLVEREQLTSNRLMMSPDMHKTLDIFVDLALVRQKKADKRDGDVLPEHGSQLYKPSRYSESERFEFQRFLKDVLSVQKNEKLTIVGEPGCGKTTLLQKIAFWLLNNTKDLVIWVSLAELKDKPLRDYLTEDWLQDAFVKANSATLEDWEQQFLNRRVWLLLDGLDEMTPETRDALSLKGWVSQARVVVTCRLNVWQTNPRLINGFATYRMLEFRLEQIKEFIQKWFSQDEEIGQNLQHALNQPGKERIRDLVRNPLRLTLLCSNWHLREGKLPDTQAELYKQFVDDLYEWKREVFPTSVQQREELNEKLGELAKEAIDKEITRFRLRHDLVCSVLGDISDPGSMLTLALNLGWINAIGVDPKNPRKPVYAFFHATLQEYFAARKIENWDFFVPSSHGNRPTIKSKEKQDLNPYRVFETQWKEVILLWLGRKDIPYDIKKDFLDLLFSFDDGCIGLYHHHSYSLAALGMLEVLDYPNSEIVIQNLVAWGFGEFDSDGKNWLSFYEVIEIEARITLLTIGGEIVAKTLSRLIKKISIKNSEVHPVLLDLADMLIKIDSENEEAIDILKIFIEKSKYDWLTLRALNLLRQVENDNPVVEKHLVTLSKHSETEWVRRKSALALLDFDPTHRIGINTLINLFCTSHDEVTLWNLNLDDVVQSNPRVLRFLIRMSYLGHSPLLRGQARAYLAKALIFDDNFLSMFSKLTNLLRMITFRKCSLGSSQILKHIMELADKSSNLNNKKDRKEAFFDLISFVINETDIILIIIRIAYSKGSEVRKQYITELFNKLNIDLADTVEVAVDLIHSMKDRVLRIFMAMRLAESGFEDPSIESILLELLEEVEVSDEHGKRWISSTLIEYDSQNSQAIHTLICLLKTSENWDTCRWVSQALGEACNDNDTITEILIEILSNTHDRYRAGGIILASEKIFNPTSLKTLVNQLRHFRSPKSHRENPLLYANSYEILWYCSSRLSYPEFYSLWHLNPDNLSENVD